MRMVHLKRIAAVAAAAGLLLAVAATPARAIPIAGDYSLIDVTSTKGLSSLSVTLTALGTAEIFNSAALGVKLVLLPVTGGDVDLPTSFWARSSTAVAGCAFRPSGAISTSRTS